MSDGITDGYNGRNFGYVYEKSSPQQAQSNEEFVRGAWELVHKCDGSYRHYSKGTILIQIRNHVFVDFPTYQAARKFTEDLLEEVRQLREEMEEINKDCHAFEHSARPVVPPEPEAHIYRRILQRLESILAEKTQGMKPEYLSSIGAGRE